MRYGFGWGFDDGMSARTFRTFSLNLVRRSGPSERGRALPNGLVTLI